MTQRINEAFTGKLEFAYHRTDEINIPSIVKNGFIPGYGDMYGKGWYMCYDLNSQLRSSMTNYGNGVIKAQIFDKGVIIFDYNVSRELFGSQYTIVDQLMRYGIFKTKSEIPKHYVDMSRICEKTFSTPSYSAHIAQQCFVQGRDPIQLDLGKNPKGYMWGEGTSCLNKRGVPKINKITAIVFSGNHDGNVVVGYSPNTVLPLEYAIIDNSVIEQYKSGQLTFSDITAMFTKLKDYDIAEARAKQARDLYERLGVLRNSSIISLDLQYAKMTSAEFEKEFAWIAKDSKVTDAEIVIDPNKKFIFEAGSWDNGVFQGDIFGDSRYAGSWSQQPTFKGGVYKSGEFYGNWEFGRFVNGVFKGRWLGKGSKRNGGIWAAPPECWDSTQAIAFAGSTFMYEIKGRFIESNLTPPDFYKSLQGPEVNFSDDKKVLVQFDKKFQGEYKVPEGVETIEVGAFYQTQVKSIILPNSLKVIKSKAFFETTNLKNVKFGSGLKEIREYAFYKSGITSLNLPLGLETIGDAAFGFSSISGNVVIPDSVNKMGFGIFTRSEISVIKLPKASNTIPGLMFKECSRLFQVTIPDNYTNIEDKAFESCTKLRQIKFPSNLKSIGDEGVFRNTGLTSIEIPDKTTYIGISAFENCNSLDTVKLPKSISVLEEGCFKNVNKITIHYDGTQRDWDNIRKNNSHYQNTLTIICKDTTFNESIKIKRSIRIPGTSFVLESGDKIYYKGKNK